MVEVIEIKLDPFITLDLNDSDNAEDQKSNGDFDFDIQDGYCSSGEIIVTEGYITIDYELIIIVFTFHDYSLRE